jgi:hypothetical protein
MTPNNSFADSYPVFPSLANAKEENVDRKARSYFQGLAAGLLGGAVMAILLPRLFRENKQSADSLLRTAPAPRPSQQAGFDFVSRREHPESSGDPAILSGSSSPNPGIAFSRPGGAPGGKVDAEMLTMPGRPGQTINFTDASEGVHMQSRSLDLGKRR